MEASSKQLDLDGEPPEVDLILAEVDNLIASAEIRLERLREYVQSIAADFEGSMKAIAELNQMTSALDALRAHRARIVR